MELIAAIAPDPSDIHFENLKQPVWKSFAFLTIIGICIFIPFFIASSYILGRPGDYKKQSKLPHWAFAFIVLVGKKIFVKTIEGTNLQYFNVVECVKRFGYLKTYSYEIVAVFVPVFMVQIGFATVQNILANLDPSNAGHLDTSVVISFF